MKKNDDVKNKLNDYAQNCAWNNFYDKGGKVEDYNRYSEIKKDLKEKENSLKSE